MPRKAVLVEADFNELLQFIEDTKFERAGVFNYSREEGTRAANPAFDVTPARLVTGLITERGLVAAEEGALRRLMEAAP